MSVILTKGHADARPFRNVADLTPFLSDQHRDHAVRASERASANALQSLHLRAYWGNPFRAGDDVYYGSSYVQAVREDYRRMAGLVEGPVAA